MREINAKEFAARVDDRIANATYNMLASLMCDFEHEDYVLEQEIDRNGEEVY